MNMPQRVFNKVDDEVLDSCETERISLGEIQQKEEEKGMKDQDEIKEKKDEPKQPII